MNSHATATASRRRRPDSGAQRRPAASVTQTQDRQEEHACRTAISRQYLTVKPITS